MIGLDFATTTLAARPGAAPFAPSRLPGLALWYDPTDRATLFQDTAQSVPVTADGDPVACIRDKSGKGHHALQADPAARPVFRDDGTARWIDFSATGAWMSCPALDLSATSALTVALRLARAASTGVGMAFEFGAETKPGNPGSFGLVAPHQSLAAPFAMLLSGASGAAIVKVGTNMAPETAVISARLDRTATSSAGAIDLRRNKSGADQSTVANMTNFGGSFGTHPLFLGRRAGATLPFNGGFFGFTICEGLLPTPTLDRLETYLMDA